MAAYRWTCACCGQEFDTLPTCWSVGPPIPYMALPEDERERRAWLDRDACVIDDREFYVRGHIEIPIVGSDEIFAWSVWASLSQASIAAIERAEEEQDWGGVGPFFGWLCSAMPYEPGTGGLKTNVHMRPGLTPLIEIEPTDHPLAVEQREGVTLARVAEIAEIFHPEQRRNG